jgi:ADP-ribose pyrophosphatase YjhB (NUDIX family)
MPPFVATAAIVERDGKILAIRDTALDMLALPGGHLRWRESVHAGLVREVREETGYIVEPLTVWGVFDARTGGVDSGIVKIVYRADIRSGTETSSAEGEVVWITPNQFATEGARDAVLLEVQSRR